jgi:hypothetical protein
MNPQTKMKPALVLRTKTAAATNLLHLLPATKKQPHFRADRALVTRSPFEVECDPLVLRGNRILVN